MAHSAPGSCPVCKGTMLVTSLKCQRCDTGLVGTFESCPFCGLSPDQRNFVLTFLRARGSIKEVERELGISYPTVRSRLAAVLAALGLAPQEDPDPVNRTDILERLGRGDITPEEAELELKGKK